MAKALLKGRFIECCDCFTICPCWVAEKADEGHCTGLYVWSFDRDAQIAGKPLEGRSVAAASYHGKGGVTHSVLLLDGEIAPEQVDALTDIYAGDAGAEFEGLRRLLGTIVLTIPANVAATGMGGDWSVKIEADGQVIAQATGSNQQVGLRGLPVALTNTALDDELSVSGEVCVQEMERLELAISLLPGGPFTYVGRAGMAGKFDYSK